MIQSLINLVKLNKIPVGDPDLILTATFFAEALKWLNEELEKESNENA